jgi:3-oxoacyl-[acyl-carrier protein] reductase
MSQAARYLTGKVALVTGGSRGIGAAICKRLASAGANIALTYAHSNDLADTIVNSCHSYSVSAMAIQADVGNVEANRKVVEQVVSNYEHIDILVNNAAIAQLVDLLSVTEADFDNFLNINLRGLFFLTQATVKQMSTGGRIINMGSIFGESASYPGLSLYSMTKFALAGLTRAWARDLAHLGITVNCIQPGPIDTDMNPEDGELAKTMKPRCPLGRYGRVEEVAETVAYLVGTNTDNVTGAIINNDGGWNA